ncbi:MAG TPA: DUF2786 domain-containing protein, partial [Microlunatus sp.]|nr:DUF2786 domain-containing protein [Microlunatus sp.]
DDLMRQFGGGDRGGRRHAEDDPGSAADAGSTAERAETRTRARDLDHEAGLLLDRLTFWATTKTSPSSFSRLVERELSGLSREVLDRLDEVASVRLLSRVGHQWERGWQPRDLIHVAARIDRWAAPLAADVAVEQIRRSDRGHLAPLAWRDQLDAAAERARSADIGVWSTRPEWLAVDRLVMAGVPALAAWTSALRLLAQLPELPPLARTLPPPSAWRAEQRAPHPPRATAPPRTTTTPGEPGPNRDKVLSTIRALLAKAESTEFAAEAEALSAKAQAMMTRHAIDEALLHVGDGDSIEVLSRRVLVDSPYPLEKVHLLSAVGRANRTRVVWMEDLAMATVVGTPVDVDQVELLFVSLLIQSTRAMAEAGTAQPGSFDRSPRFRRSFLTSYAVRIGERLSAADAETTASYGSELVPVLRRQEEVVDAVYEELFPHTREATATRTYDRRGWDAGRQAADRASFVAGRLAG